MRSLLRRIGARGGISFGLILVVAAVVIVARIAGGEREPTPYYADPDTTPSVASTVGDDGAVAPTASAYSDDSAITAAASTFTVAWLRRTLPANQWLDGLRPLATANLIQKLSGVDPLDVPDVAAPGQPVVRLRSELYAQVRVPIGNQAILLGLIRQGGGWLADTLDLDDV